ncbi:MAG TPA: hypothetical protein VGM80_04665 [Gaiellaceae bacterium]
MSRGVASRRDGPNRREGAGRGARRAEAPGAESPASQQLEQPDLAAIQALAPGLGGTRLNGALGETGAGTLSPALLRGLQRTAGNAAVGALIARDEAAVAAPAAGPSIKNTATFPEKELGEKELDYVTVTLSLGGSIDYEYTPAATPATGTPAASPQASTSTSASPSPENTTAPPPQADGSNGPTPLPSPKDGEVKGSGGINAGPDGGKYQAEVGIEFEKRATGILEGCTPKAKIGGETDGDKGGKLGVEFSLEGDKFEPKFAFNLFEMDAQKGIHFAQLETAVDWKIHEWTFNAADGTALKITPKATLKVAIEPNYEAIFQYLLEEGGAEVVAEVAIAGGMILIGVVTIVATLATLGDGEDEAKAIDNAEKAKDQIVSGFVMGATGEPGDFKDDFTMEGYLRGKQWRDDLTAGNRGRGIPVPPSVLDTKAKELKEQLRAGAEKTATQMMHDELVRRYWEIHYAQRLIPWSEIDTVFMMLMEGQGFGRPGPQEGKNASGASLLPE